MEENDQQAKQGVDHQKNATDKPHQYWRKFFAVFGEECYRTWRGELLASALCSGATFVITWARDQLVWSTLKTALCATALTLAGYAIWHLIKVPYLLTKPREKYHNLAAGFGIFILFCLIAGAATTAVVGMKALNFRAISSATPPAAPATNPPPMQEAGGTQ